MEAKTEEKWKKFGKSSLKIAGSLLAGRLLGHPFAYSNALIQLGCEPVALKKGKSWWIFGEDVLRLPSGLYHVWHVVQHRGIFGVYSGVGLGLCSDSLALASNWAISKGFQLSNLEKYLLGSDRVLDASVLFSGGLEFEAVKALSLQGFKGTLSVCLSTIFTWPIQVVLYRRWAQFIGGETAYNGIFGPFRTIYEQEGLQGFFKGLVPQLVAQVISFWSLHYGIFLLKGLIFGRKSLKAKEDPKPYLCEITKPIWTENFGFETGTSDEDGSFVIRSLTAGGAAENAGLLIGLRIVGVDDVILSDDTTLEELQQLLDQSKNTLQLLVTTPKTYSWYRSHGKAFSFQEAENVPKMALQTQSGKAVLMYGVQYLAHPFKLVATVMAVNGSKLTAVNPPRLPIFENWWECWKHFSEKGQLHKGFQFALRGVHKGAIVQEQGKVYAAE